MGTAPAQGVHYCSFDKSGETGLGLRHPHLLQPGFLGGSCAWPHSLSGSQLAWRARLREHDHQGPCAKTRVPKGTCAVYLNAEVQEGVCVCVYVGTSEHMCLYVHVCTRSTQLCLRIDRQAFPASLRFYGRCRGHFLVFSQKWDSGTSLVIQWLRLRAPKAGGLGSTPGQGTRSHQCRQINIFFEKWDSRTSPLVQTPHSQDRGHRVRSLVRQPRSHRPHGVAKKKILFKGWKSHCLHQAFVEAWSPVPGTHPVGAHVFTRRGRDRWPLLCCVEEEGGGELAGLDSSVAPGHSGWGRRGGVVLRDRRGCPREGTLPRGDGEAPVCTVARV